MDAQIVTFDEATFRLVPVNKRVWGLKGTKPKIPFWFSNTKANIFGALIDGKKLHYEWYEKLTADYFISFIERFVKTIDATEKYVFVFDNAPAHKAKKSKEFLNSLGKNIYIEFLPTYSPQLNCIETCWKIIRYNVTSSRIFKSIEDLKKGVEMFVDEFSFRLNPSKYLSR